MPVSMSVVDSMYGQPAGGVLVTVARREQDDWRTVLSRRTDQRGRLGSGSDTPLAPGLYRVVLDAVGYFATLGIVPSCLEIAIVLRLSGDEESRHVLIGLSPHACVLLASS
jgi:5-hydroxyisourate hydrolase-like protein (transthyretin family)